jgi:predicted transcriptional regulator
MDAVFKLGKATAAEIVASIPDPPTKGAIRRLIRILEEKGLLDHEVDGVRHVYFSTIEPEKARRTALDHVVQTHFKGSVSQAIAALLESSAENLTEEDFVEISGFIKEVAKEGR